MNDIQQKTKFGIFWNFVEKFSSQFIAFIINVILARLLSPHDYGTIGMLAIFLTFSNVFIDCGFSRALIQKQDRNESDFSTALFYNLIVSILIYLILFIFSPIIADFYKMPDLIHVERIFFLVLIINSLYIVQIAQLQIEVNFRRIAFVNTLAQLLSGIIGIICAYIGWGVWALVMQQLSRGLICNILFWCFGKWIPTAKISFNSLKHLLNYGSKILVSGLLGNFADGLINMIIGKAYSPSDLGYYTRAQQFPDLTSGTITSVLSTTTFPLMAKLQDDFEAFRKIYVRLVKLVSMFIFPMMIGLAVLSKPIILCLLGEKWGDTSELLFWLALSSFFGPINVVNTNVLNAIGRTDIYMRLSFIKIPINLVVFFISYRISLKAVVIYKAGASIIYFFINAFYSGNKYNFSPIKQLFSIWKYAFSALLMGSCILLIMKFSVLPNIIYIILLIPFGIISYAFILFILRDNEYLTLLTNIKNKVIKK